MQTVSLFEALLPYPDDPHQAEIHDRLVAVLNSEGEILPSANSPRGKLWRLVNSPDTSIEECEEVVRLDTALASRLLRVANSSAYGLNSDDLSKAILRLGLKFIREQVFNAGVFKQYSAWTLPQEWDLFWLRSIFVARLCERISAKFGGTNGSEYLVGLIHDIGWLFLATYVPDEFTRLFACGKPLPEAERDYLPCGHAAIAAAIALRSSLPPRSIEAILYHHESDLAHLDQAAPRQDPRFLGLILTLCDRLADTCEMDMFDPCRLTREQIIQSPEVRWLNQFANLRDLSVIADEELAKSREIFNVYFSNRRFN